MHPLKAIDKEHKQLTDLLDNMYKNMSNGCSRDLMYKNLADFVILSEIHFKNEEKLMEFYQYPHILAHKKEHSDLLEQLYTMKSQLENGQTPFGKDCLIWLKNWLEQHISGEDKILEEYLCWNVKVV